MANVVTTLVVQFQSATAGLSAEIDSRPTGLNLGNTSFVPGDLAYFLVYPTGGATITQVLSSVGSVSSAGSVTIEVEETLTFANTNKANLSKQYVSGATYTWYGNNLGAVTFKGTQVIAATSGVGVLSVKYNTTAYAYAINSPTLVNGKTSFQILVVIIGAEP
jgi:hypothetical protein